jgi:hypothetical protein
MKSELDDWLTELPPLDGAPDEPEADEGSTDDLLTDIDDDSSLDDSAADDLEVDEAVEIAEDAPGGGDDESWEADVGEPELDLTDGDEGGSPEVEAPAGDGDFELDENLPDSDDDAGEEGTTDPIEHSIDEELPALDADDEGDFEDALLLEAGIGAAPPDMPRWADAAWEERPSSSRSLPWGASEVDPVVAMAMHTARDVVVAATLTGNLWTSYHGCNTTTPAGEIRKHLDARGSSGGPFMVALSSSDKGAVIWVANGAGHLTKSADFGKTWTARAGVGRPILALTTREDGSLSALAQKGRVTELLTSTDGARWFTQRISADLRAGEFGSSPRPCWLSHRGSAVAIGDELGVWLSRDGLHFERVSASAGAVAGAFAGSSSLAPLIFAIAAENDEAAHLVRVADDGTAEILAEVETQGEGDPPSIYALGWDEATGALRVALSTRVGVWGPSPKDLT